MKGKIYTLNELYQLGWKSECDGGVWYILKKEKNSIVWKKTKDDKGKIIDTYSIEKP